MMAPQMKTNFQIRTKPNAQPQSRELNAILRSQIAHLWPTIANIAALQKDCVTALPNLFLYCEVIQLESEQLILATPNAALATKLKQQLPKLQDYLQKRGWQINAIRLKVQVSQQQQPEPVQKQCHFTTSALAAFSTLEQNLARSSHNENLCQALRSLLSKYPQSGQATKESV